MDIRFYNTLEHAIQPFASEQPRIVRMYNCGPTVYDYAHIGNFRSFLFADTLRRFLEYMGYQVQQVMNLTDVGHMTEDQLADGGGEDKMQVAAERLKAAKKQGKAPVENPNDPYQVADYYIRAFVEDARLLGLKVAADDCRYMPRATDYVQSMIQLIEQLIANGHAYVAEDGAVYYDVCSFPEYGRLSGNTLEKLHVGAGGRIDADTQSNKRHPADFLLWKPDDRHLMKWDSPWGAGYPGWHVECSAMARAVLGVDTLDIHTGGEDNIFPHHECEIAQSTGATGKPFARFWMHARYLLVEGEKMSKRRGNFFTVRDLLQKHVSPASIRLVLIGSHYRQNMNFTFKGLADAQKQIERLKRFVDHHSSVSGDEQPPLSTAVEQAFADHLSDDLNMAGALGELFKWMQPIDLPTAEQVGVVRRLDRILGLLALADAQASGAPDGLTDAQLDDLCRQIDAARAEKNYDQSDKIRDQLIAAGIDVQISRAGTRWQRKIIQ